MLLLRVATRGPVARNGFARSVAVAPTKNIKMGLGLPLPFDRGGLQIRTVASQTVTPRINGKRLMDTIHETCEMGKAHRYGEHYTETGMARLALDDDDKTVRLWLIKQAKAIGCSVTVDEMGNMFIVRPGRSTDPTVAPVYMGSHLDTQLTGGRYDGILGVMAGLEALRTLHETGDETKGPVGLVNWTNEEGARFPMTTMSSAVWAGTVPLERAWNTREITAPAAGRSESATVKQELERIGFLGTVAASHTATPMAAHFELHIEQGPILEDTQRRIGVVHGAQGYQWFEVEVVGRDSHAGTTPLAARRDAMLAAARMIAASHSVAVTHSGVITTGVVKTEPGTINTIVRVARFTLDMRHPKADALATMVQECKTQFDAVARDGTATGQGIAVHWRQLAKSPPVTFHKDCIAAIEDAAADELREKPQGKTLWMPLWSGAGHDSCNTSKHCPTGMVFTPTRDGLSHTPTEYCSPEDCILGAQVLLGAVLRFDAQRRE